MPRAHLLDRSTSLDRAPAPVSDWAVIDLTAQTPSHRGPIDLDEWEGVFFPEPPRVDEATGALPRRLLDALRTITQLALTVVGTMAAIALWSAVEVLHVADRSVSVRGTVDLPASTTAAAWVLTVAAAWLVWQLATIRQLRLLGRNPGSAAWAALTWPLPVVDLVAARRTHLRLFRAAGPHGADAQVPIALASWSRSWLLARLVLLATLGLHAPLPVVAAVLLPLGLALLVWAAVGAIRLVGEVHAKVDALGAAAGLPR